MSKQTTVYCDICGEICLPELNLEGPGSLDGYSTGVHVAITGRRHQPLDVCTSCQISSIKHLYEAFASKLER